MSITLNEAAAGVALFGGALITLGTIGFAIYKAAAGAFNIAVTQHVAPLVTELKLSLVTLNSTMAQLKDDHDTTKARLDGHDEDLGTLAERQARIEGRLSGTVLGVDGHHPHGGR